MDFASILRYPDYVVMTPEGKPEEALACTGPSAVFADGVTVSFALDGEGLHIFLTAGETPVSFVRLRWNTPMPEGADYLGDDWERSYGTLEWRRLVPDRAMPWYFLVSRKEMTAGYGVRVRPGAMCFWQADEDGVTLWMDVRNGGSGVILQGRALACATVVWQCSEGIGSFAAAQKFCGIMCTDPLLPKEPVYGSNNWYYAYGQSSHEEILRDSDYLRELMPKDPGAKPYLVIDSCWQPSIHRDGGAGGPWDRGNERFPDMPGLAAQIKKRGQKPGIWMRLLTSYDESVPQEWCLPLRPARLDPSVPEVLEDVKANVRRVAGWGYQLLKHDFSTYDIFGTWGFQMQPFCPQKTGWHFHDTSRTTAEIIVDFYKAVREAAGEMVILGCNCVGHLGAGLMHAQRIGDDTSGREWERTRRMGVNTLAFRLPQNGTFFSTDADCVGVMGPVPWEKNRQWAHLLAYSGTPLFLSVKPGILTEEQKEELRALLKVASRQNTTAIPLDWMENVTPSRWKIGDETVRYHWYDKTGIPKPGR